MVLGQTPGIIQQGLNIPLEDPVAKKRRELQEQYYQAVVPPTRGAKIEDIGSAFQQGSQKGGFLGGLGEAAGKGMEFLGTKQGMNLVAGLTPDKEYREAYLKQGSQLGAGEQAQQQAYKEQLKQIAEQETKSEQERMLKESELGQRQREAEISASTSKYATNVQASTAAKQLEQDASKFLTTQDFDKMKAQADQIKNPEERIKFINAYTQSKGSGVSPKTKGALWWKEKEFTPNISKQAQQEKAAKENVGWSKT